MKQISLICLVSGILFSQISLAQQKALTIGDPMPNLLFKEVMNYHKKQARFSDFKAKLTILDIWSTSCSVCVALFPHMQQLKDKFQGQLQIVLVNGKTAVWHDDQKKITSLLNKQKMKTGTTISLPIVLNSKEFDDAFPYSKLPQEIWINDRGKIIAITGQEEVNDKNIEDIISGQSVSMHAKKDVMVDLDTISLQKLMYGDTQMKPEYSSILIRGFIDGLNGTGSRRINDSKPFLFTGWYSVNQTPFWLLEQAFSDIIQVPLNQVLIHTKDQDKFSKVFPRDTSLYGKVYSYDLTVPPTDPMIIHKYVQGELAKIFNVEVRTGREELDCFVIESTDKLKINNTQGPEDENIEGSGLRKYIHNYPIKNAVSFFNQYSPVPLIDSSNLNVKVDIELPVKYYEDLSDRQKLKVCLEQAGFKIREEKKVMNVVIIKDKN